MEHHYPPGPVSCPTSRLLLSSFFTFFPFSFWYSRLIAVPVPQGSFFARSCDPSNEETCREPDPPHLLRQPVCVDDSRFGSAPSYAIGIFPTPRTSSLSSIPLFRMPLSFMRSLYDARSLQPSLDNTHPDLAPACDLFLEFSAIRPCTRRF